MTLIVKKKSPDFGFYLFCVPALLFYIVFYIYPALSGFFYSLTDWSNLRNNINFIGFKNYIEVFEDFELLNSLKVTVIYTIIMCVFQNIFGLVLALLIDSPLKGKNIYRLLIFLPYILPTVVSSNIWVYIYNPINGLLTVISQTMGLGQLDVLGSSDYALIGVIVTNLWQMLGFSMVIYFAALQSIPGDIVESGEVDGANWWIRIIKIKLPLIIPAVTINMVYTLVNGLKVFDYIYIMTNGGPGKATQTISAAVYFSAFNVGRYGYASAMGVILFVMIAIVSYFMLSSLRKMEVVM